jgi:H+/gluconate symporter-like permease
VLLLAPAAALIAAAFAREPLLAHWTQTFMGGAAQFLAQFFPLFLLGAVFGKFMDDSGAVTVIAGFMTERLGAARAVLAVVLAGAIALRVRRKSPRAISTSSWSRLPER